MVPLILGNPHFEVLSLGPLCLALWSAAPKSMTCWTQPSLQVRGFGFLYGDCPKLLSIRGPFLGSYDNTGPFLNFPHFGNSNSGKPPYTSDVLGGV